MTSSSGKKQKLSQELSQFRTQLSNMVNEHRDSEANLRRRKWKLETEVENWIHKYDSDMGERQMDFEEVDSVYTEERKQLVELEERFKVRRTKGEPAIRRRSTELSSQW